MAQTKNKPKYTTNSKIGKNFQRKVYKSPVVSGQNFEDVGLREKKVNNI